MRRRVGEEIKDKAGATTCVLTLGALTLIIIRFWFFVSGCYLMLYRKVSRLPFLGAHFELRFRQVNIETTQKVTQGWGFRKCR
jgi:hypothetical protein